MTQGGRCPRVVAPAEMSSSQMMPMVFCASLLPWPMLYIAEEASCSRRNQRSTLRGAARTHAHDTPIFSRAPSVNPRSGATKMNAAVFRMPGASSGSAPALARVAPIMPPMSACDELDGMP